jgi:hypothetical protein
MMKYNKMMISENDRFKEAYNSLNDTIKFGKKPLIVTEGKTNVMYLKKSKEKLEIEDCDIDFFDFEQEKSFGCDKLRNLLKSISKIKPRRKIIGIFDRNVYKVVEDIESGSIKWECKNYSNNGYTFCIPPVNENIYGTLF